jgi:beta propeller repeat protein
MIEGTATQVTNVADGQSAPSISGNIVVYTDDSIGNLVVRFIDLGPPQIDTLLAGGPGDQRLHDVDGTNIVYASKDMLARRPTQFS